MFDTSLIVETCPNNREYFRRIWARLRCLPVSVSSVCRNYLLVQILSIVTEQTVVNIFLSSFKRRAQPDSRLYSVSDYFEQRFLSMAMQSLLGMGLRIFESSHSVKPHSTEILWMTDQLDAETYTYTTHKTTTDRRKYHRWVSNTQCPERTVLDRRIKVRVHWDQHVWSS